MLPAIKKLSAIFIFLGLFSIFANLQISAFPYFDRDGKADFAVFRRSDRSWYVNSSEDKSFSATQWGLTTDKLVPGDYDGDGLTDYSVWRPQTGIWYVLRSSDKTLLTQKWGMQPVAPPQTISFLSTDEPVAADYDGDGITDFAVWRPDTGVWYILKSSENFSQNNPQVFRWGKLGDIPVPADYDGDRKTDYAVFRGNLWHIFQSQSASWRVVNFGKQGSDFLVPADYTGDGKTDIAVFRNGSWFIERSDNGQTETYNFGLSSDTPAPADYDGDKKTDIAVYRKGVWYILMSSTAQMEVFNFGLSDDIPLASLNVKQSIVGIP
jgi:hypothetical protein